MNIIFSALLSVTSPVAGPIVEDFRAPACERCAGHRGVTVETQVGSHMRAAKSGTIIFLGSVAGLTYVVQRVSPTVRITYGWFTPSAQIAEGSYIGEGETLGFTGTRTYVGVRVGAQYVHPLRALGLAGARLVGPSQILRVLGKASR